MNSIVQRGLFVAAITLVVGGLDAAISLPTFDDPGEELIRLEYFLDVDPGFGEGTSLPFSQDDDGRVLARIGSLPLGGQVGFRSLYVRALNRRGDWSVPSRHSFHIGPVAVRQRPEITRGEYFLGEDPGYGNGTAILLSDTGSSQSLRFGIELNEGGTGSQRFYMRFQDSLGNWSLPVEGVVFRLPQLPVTQIEWMIAEGETQLSSGIYSITPPETELVRLIPTGLIGDDSLQGRELTFQANLVLANRVPTVPVSEAFSVAVQDEEMSMDFDRDGDGLPDRVETNTGVFEGLANTGTDPDNPDSDGDGIPDGIEVNFPMRPNLGDEDLVQFFADRVSDLSFGISVVRRDQEGRFLIRLVLDESSGLDEWTPIELSSDAVGVDRGELVIEIESMDRDILFFLLRGIGESR